MSSFQLQADMYNSITPEEVKIKEDETKIKELEERVKELENKVKLLELCLINKKIMLNSLYGVQGYRDTDMDPLKNEKGGRQWTIIHFFTL